MTSIMARAARGWDERNFEIAPGACARAAVYSVAAVAAGRKRVNISILNSRGYAPPPSLAV